MKRISFVFLLCTLLLTAAFPKSAPGQDRPKSEQIDQFARPSCEDLKARGTYFANQISTEPTSKALVIVLPGKDRLDTIKRYFRQILVDFAYYNVEDRVDFLISNDGVEPVWEFWKIPAGAVGPNVKGDRWTLPTPDVKKPFIYGYEDENEICPTFINRRFAELLIKNPGSRAHIVVKKSTVDPSSSSRGFADQWVQELTTKHSIPKDRIRVFYVRGDSVWTYAEFWFVPAKKR